MDNTNNPAGKPVPQRRVPPPRARSTEADDDVNVKPLRREDFFDEDNFVSNKGEDRCDGDRWRRNRATPVFVGCYRHLESDDEVQRSAATADKTGALPRTRRREVDCDPKHQCTTHPAVRDEALHAKAPRATLGRCHRRIRWPN